jgi:hypothetical protein
MGARDSMVNSIHMEQRARRPLLVSAGAADNCFKFLSAQSVLLFLNITLLDCNGMISSL